MKTRGLNSSLEIVPSAMTDSQVPTRTRFALSPGESWDATGTTTALEGESGHETKDQNPVRSHRAAACMAASSDASSRPDARADDDYIRRRGELIKPARANGGRAADAPPRIATDSERSDLSRDLAA